MDLPKRELTPFEACVSDLVAELRAWMNGCKTLDEQLAFFRAAQKMWNDENSRPFGARNSDRLVFSCALMAAHFQIFAEDEGWIGYEGQAALAKHLEQLANANLQRPARN